MNLEMKNSFQFTTQNLGFLISLKINLVGY